MITGPLPRKRTATTAELAPSAVADSRHPRLLRRRCRLRVPLLRRRIGLPGTPHRSPLPRRPAAGAGSRPMSSTGCSPTDLPRTRSPSVGDSTADASDSLQRSGRGPGKANERSPEPSPTQRLSQPSRPWKPDPRARRRRSTRPLATSTKPVPKLTRAKGYKTKVVIKGSIREFVLGQGGPPLWIISTSLRAYGLLAPL